MNKNGKRKTTQAVHRNASFKRQKWLLSMCIKSIYRWPWCKRNVTKACSFTAQIDMSRAKYLSSLILAYRFFQPDRKNPPVTNAIWRLDVFGWMFRCVDCNIATLNAHFNSISLSLRMHVKLSNKMQPNFVSFVEFLRCIRAIVWPPFFPIVLFIAYWNQPTTNRTKNHPHTHTHMHTYTHHGHRIKVVQMYLHRKSVQIKFQCPNQIKQDNLHIDFCQMVKCFRNSTWRDIRQYVWFLFIFGLKPPHNLWTAENEWWHVSKCLQKWDFRNWH